MSIVEEYEKQLELKHFKHDPEQEKVVEKLHLLQQELEQHQSQKSSLSYKIKKSMGLNAPYPYGLYIWGDVGRGKTWLMDMFYDTLEQYPLIAEQKIRLHFHHFMRTIHDQLSLVGEFKNPLQRIAKSFARRYQLICLDEFHVSDITDAMLLYGLLEALFDEGITLVATSNQPPDELYKNGLQRERFLPAIELIKQNTDTLNLDGPVDHRLRLLETADTWYGIKDTSDTILEKRFLELITSPAQRNHKIHINYRSIQTVLYTNNIIWLDFEDICGDQRGSSDYIEIACQFHTVFISNIPVMDDSLNDKARRFINMIDEFYDRNVNLLVSAANTPEYLYIGKQYASEYKRTASRLLEMRSHNYMQQAHKPT